MSDTIMTRERHYRDNILLHAKQPGSEALKVKVEE